MPTWDSAPADDLWTETCGKDRWLGTARPWSRTSAASPTPGLAVSHRRQQVAGRVRPGATVPGTGRVRRAARRGGGCQASVRSQHPHARLRAALRHVQEAQPAAARPQRLLRLVDAIPHRPVQLIIAGKAHPADQAGQALIREWTHFIRRPEMRPHAIFLSDYDMLLTEQLVQGVDVWINTPRRPWEACGTSGMKVLVNGGINLSELDGWWAEAYTPKLGGRWATAGARRRSSLGRRRSRSPVRPAGARGNPRILYSRRNGIPAAWVARMRESMARLTPGFAASRAVREYTEQHYLPAAAAYRERAAHKGAVGKQVVDWRHEVDGSGPRCASMTCGSTPMRTITCLKSKSL